MADTKEEKPAEEVGEAPEGEGEEGKKNKGGGLAVMLPTLLKFGAIGLGALVLIVTVSVVTYMLLNKSGQSQTIIPENSPYSNERPIYATFGAMGVVRTSTRDEVPYTVVVDMVIGYDLNDNAAATELTGRITELQDFERRFFRGKTAAELAPENEERLKQEIIELLNTRWLNVAKARAIYFKQLDVMPTQ
ncbi:MAG: flagellar basal body-associated protein FliL [Treponematales bacterium]|jgi:flagellar FliL protein